LLLISDALQRGGDGSFALHPALAESGRTLAKRRRRWFSCTDNKPLGWYAALVGSSPAALLAAGCPHLPVAARQGWVASPFHAMPGRDSVRLLPESDLPWDGHDADWLCAELNPLLMQEGMALHACGAALLLTCEHPIEAEPAAFAAIAGGLLPDRHPAGPDGGRLMRLLAEIQMSLHASGQPTRAGKPAVNGLWLWGACTLPKGLAANLPAVAAADPYLQALHHSQGANLAICEAVRLSALQLQDGLPGNVVLAGADHAVLLRPSSMPNWSKGWQPKSSLGEDRLIARLREMIDAF